MQDECDYVNTLQAAWFAVVWRYNLLLEELLGHVKPFDDPRLAAVKPEHPCRQRSGVEFTNLLALGNDTDGQIHKERKYGSVKMRHQLSISTKVVTACALSKSSFVTRRGNNLKVSFDAVSSGSIPEHGGTSETGMRPHAFDGISRRQAQNTVQKVARDGFGSLQVVQNRICTIADSPSEALGASNYESKRTRWKPYRHVCTASEHSGKIECVRMPESCAKIAADFGGKGGSLPTNFADVVCNKPANIHTYHAERGNLNSGTFEELSEQRGQGIQGCDCSSGEASHRHEEPLRRDEGADCVPRILELDRLIPCQARVGTLIIPSMLDDLVVGHGRFDLHWDLPDFSAFKHDVTVAFATWLSRKWPDWSQTSKLHVYTDGTHDPERSQGAWAVACALEQVDGTWVWIGMLSNVCNQLGFSSDGPCTDAYAPEIVAILHGLVVACACKVDAILRYDCQSAADAVSGRACSELDIVKEAMSMLEINRCVGVDVQFVHEKSHSGIALNELVDGLAKLACKGVIFPPNGDEVDGFVHDKLLQWLWLALGTTQAQWQWPCVDPLGGTFLLNVDSSVGVVGRSKLNENEEVSNSTSSGCNGPEVKDEAAKLQIVTYNPTTPRTKAHRSALERVLVENCVDVAGLQECRSSHDHISETERFKCFGSAGVSGQFGCEIWIAKKSGWDMQSVAIVKQEPRCVCVVGRFAGQLMAMLGSDTVLEKSVLQSIVMLRTCSL